MDSGPATVVFQLRKKRRRAVVEADTARRNAICLYLISQNCLTATWLCGAKTVKSWAPKLPIPYNPLHRLRIEEMPEGSLLNHQVHKEMRLRFGKAEIVEMADLLAIPDTYVGIPRATRLGPLRLLSLNDIRVGSLWLLVGRYHVVRRAVETCGRVGSRCDGA
jgi:hypothetical protein